MKKIIFILIVIFAIMSCDSPIVLKTTLEELAHNGAYHENDTCPYNYLDCKYY